MRDKINHLRILNTLLLIVCSVYNSLAQNVFVETIIYGGTNFSNLHTKYKEYDYALGGQGGLMIKVGNRFIQFESGLEYSYQAYKYDNKVDVGYVNNSNRETIKINTTFASHHITIPASIALGVWDDEGYGGISVSGGVYADAGLYGRTTVEEKRLFYKGHILEYVSDETKYKTNLYGDLNHQKKRFDAGWQVGCLIGIGTVIRIGATYRHGLINISNIPHYKQYNKCFMINLLFCISHE